MNNLENAIMGEAVKSNFKAGDVVRLSPLGRERFAGPRYGGGPRFDMRPRTIKRINKNGHLIFFTSGPSESASWHPDFWELVPPEETGGQPL